MPRSLRFALSVAAALAFGLTASAAAWTPADTTGTVVAPQDPPPPPTTLPPPESAPPPPPRVDPPRADPAPAASPRTEAPRVETHAPDPPQRATERTSSSTRDPEPQRTSPQTPTRTPPPGAPRTGTATPRSSPPPSSGGSGGSTASRPSSGSGSSRGESAAGRSGAATGRTVPFDPRASRDRQGRPITGEAVPREQLGFLDPAFPLFGPWGRWYPWYGTGFNSGFGFVTYNPWVYGSTRWVWGRYGLWYDPFWYDPWYDPWYGYGGYAYGGRSDRRETREARAETGSIRFRVKPETARIYINGALVGTVADFNGLRHHLELDAGMHQLELRADGYRPYTGELEVVAGKTLTERVTLRKQ